MKIIAFYLPQFHNIPENDEWWGDGFTEWTNVKSATPLFEGHKQPKIPLNNNYYNLLDDDVKIWQANLAKKYGIYGFCYYHYWFNGRLLLEKPMEQMLANKNVKLPFCICWANEPWTKSWVGEQKVLIAQHYGNEQDWEKHFNYMLPFFKDERYITENNKPLLCIYRPYMIPRLKEMLTFWNKLAEENGFAGLTIIGKYADSAFLKKDYDCFDYIMEWQPSCVKTSVQKKEKKLKSRLKHVVYRFDEYFGTQIALTLSKNKGNNAGNLDYDEVWSDIVKMKPLCSKSIPGAFIRWDNSPRKHNNKGLILGETPESFKKYLSLQIKHAINDYKQDKIFMFAWNEWAEGGFLEPDEDNKYAYLEALKDALAENNELPDYKI